jgi:hypothetical protein
MVKFEDHHNSRIIMIMQQQQKATPQQMTQGQPGGISDKHAVQSGGTVELEKWAKKIGPRSVAAAARYRKGPETQQQD